MDDARQEAKQHIKRLMMERGDVVALEDGDFYYWQNSTSGGAISAGELRIMADILDEMNNKAANLRS